jgi:hypothetical protein
LADHEPFRRRDRKRIKLLIETTLAVSASDGTICDAGAELPWRVVREYADRATGDRSSKLSRQVRALVANDRLGKSSGLPGRPSRQSDAGGWAILRASWHGNSDTVLVRHEAPEVRLQLDAAGSRLLGGVWDLKAVANDTPLSPRQPWECVCWFADRDGDYLELQQVFSDDLKVERQVYLSRTNHFLFLNDVVHPAAEASLTLSCVLPVDPRLTLKRDKRTREYALCAGRARLARLFPLALEQDVAHKSAGELVQADGRTVLTASGTGGLCSPLVLDWHPRRLKLPAEWRRLTVSENRRACRPSEAAGYRLRIGQRHHVLFYRAIQTSDYPRAVLGHHTTNETIIADFTRDGEVDPLLMVE